jgi:hypothetical protein
MNADDLAAAIRAYVGPKDLPLLSDGDKPETWYIDIDHSETDEELLNLAQEIIRAWERSRS